MSDLLAERWAAVRARGTAALIPYITAGFPDAAATRDMLAGAASAGADFLELGIPWSDPVADGPVIQSSTHHALKAGMTLEGALSVLASVTSVTSVTSVPPTIIFSYINPILAYGPRRFAARVREVGGAAILVTDLPVGADTALEGELRSSGLPLVRLVAPTTSPERLAVVARASEGFVYLIARLGVTGRTDEATKRNDELAARVKAARAASKLPVAVGFGISEPDQARDVAAQADGVVIGSALVERMNAGGAREALDWLRQVRRAMDQAGSA